MEKSSSTDSLASLSIIDDHFERRQRDASKSSRRRVLIGVGSLAILLLFFTIGFNASSSNVLGSASFGTSSALDRMRASEATFQRMKQRRADFIASKGGLDQVTATPFVSRNDPRSFCVLYDGGKWVCGLHEKGEADQLVVYSMGINGQSDFESELLERTNAEIFGYDFSVASFGPEITSRPDYLARSHFFPYKIDGHDDAAASPPVHRLSTLMEMNGHSYIDLFKIDIEGYEWDLFRSILTHYGDQPLPFGQLQIEIHLTDGHSFREFHDWMTALEDHGLRPFNSEANLLAMGVSQPDPKWFEYSFVNIANPRSIFYIPS